jgi:hypothetical protein
MALTNAVYLHPRGFGFQPVRTECTIQVQPGSAWEGGTLEFQSEGWEAIARHPIRAGAVKSTQSTPAAGLPVTRGVPSGLRQAGPGNVPPAAFRLGEMREALRLFVHILR